jgi:hypothetical protein
VNKVNRFAVMQIHYTADPDKRSEEWKMRMASRMPGGLGGADWRRYMEIDWSIRKGEPVFSEFIYTPGHASVSHVLESTYPIPEHWSRRVGMDPGAVNPFAVSFVAISPEGIRFWYDELYVRNAYNLAVHTTNNTYLTGLAAMKYQIRSKMAHDLFDEIYVDPASKQRQLISLGPEAPRTNLLEQLQKEPHSLPCRPARRAGNEATEIERFRTEIFMRKHYKTLSQETMLVLGVEPNEHGYNLFGGYFMTSCKAHIHEFKNLKWEENPDPRINSPEKIQDFDNHTWDSSKYLLSEPWDPKRIPRPKFDSLTDWRKVRGLEIQEQLDAAGKMLAARQNSDTTAHSDWEGDH